ncbi:MAG TPA: hypothetical protein VNW92_13605 [Polyangiaceae bacterium]|jgi:hypothetical protein|nr:hypothetical protein [Polyangiaceae bacterium]
MGNPRAACGECGESDSGSENPSDEPLDFAESLDPDARLTPVMSTPDWARSADSEGDASAQDHFGDEAPTRLMLKPGNC